LERFVEEGEINWGGLEKAVRIGVRFLDNVIDYNKDRHALEEQKINAIEDRRIGLGITGLGDMILKRGLKYDSEEAIEETEKVMEFIRNKAYETSIDLAEERGNFPNFDKTKYLQGNFIKSLPEEIQEKINNKGIRNGTILTVAPTGTGSIIAEVSSGIEPIFAINYDRRVKKKNSGAREDYETYKVTHPAIKKMFGNIQKEELPEIVQEAHEINYLARVKLQGAVQKYIDSSISSTINLPEDISLETVRQIYLEAYKRGLKGVTIYREGSREGILISEKKGGLEKRIEKEDLISIPSTMPSLRIRQNTPNGKLHAQIVLDPNKNYYPVEFFATISNAGAQEAAEVEALSRSVSVWLRANGNYKVLADQYEKIGSSSGVVSRDGEVLSIPMGFSRVLNKFDYYLQNEMIEGILLGKIDYDKADAEASDHLRKNFGKINENKLEINDKFEKSEDQKKEKKLSEKCPECGAPLIHEEGCKKCSSCSFSRC
jgi:ribonucleoside-diphosphate reductase alpha chain